jgi:anti-sigma factor RsiW
MLDLSALEGTEADADVARVFPDSASVHQALRALAHGSAAKAASPEARRKKSASSPAYARSGAPPSALRKSSNSSFEVFAS